MDTSERRRRSCGRPLQMKGWMRCLYIVWWTCKDPTGAISYRIGFEMVILHMAVIALGS